MTNNTIFPVMVLLSSIIVHLTMLVIFWVIANLSKIMGNALKKKPFYKGYYLSSSFIIIGQAIYFSGFEKLTFILDLIALTIASLITFYYWSWLPKDLLKG